MSDATNTWATVVNGLSAGAHVITATATDAAGNQSAPSPGRSINVVPATLSPVIASAGDIACDDVGTTRCRQIATSDLILEGNYDAVLTLGDHQYECGSSSEFALGYEPSWGRVKSITRPSVGNHEYFTTGGIDCDTTGTAADYFDYFGAAAGSPSEGWYSYDLGDWHLISLNSNCSKIGGCGAGSPQEEWLRADLAANPTACTAAYWHDPRWSSGAAHGSNTATAALVDALYEYGVDLILAGHDHHYERFAPQAPDGTADPQYGIREFVVGTGGFSVRPLGAIEANSEFQWNTEFGILELTLGSGSYDWAFLTESGTTPDSGSAPCHGVPSGDTPPRVIGTNPANQATDVPVNSTVTATFSEPMNPGSLADSTFWLLPEASPPPTAPCPSGECLPTVDLPGWTQIFTDDFTEEIPEGQFPAATNGQWWAYPSGWADTSGNGTYEPNIISTHDGLMDINLRTEGGQHLVAAPVPNINGPAAGRDQLYGRYAVRFRADPVPGYKTAWLLWPQSGVMPRDGEIDFPEGDLDDVIKAYMHRQDATDPGDQDRFLTSETYESWHTAVTEWSPTEVRFILDGVVIGTVTDRIPNTPMHWVLQTETQINGGPPSAGATGHVTIDWAAAWSYTPSATTAVPATVSYDAGGSTATLTPDAALAPGLTYTAVIDGATDENGNPLPVTAWSFRTESDSNTPPETTITSGPSDPSPSPDATFVFTANEPATFECSLDGATASACTSPATFTGLGEGPHTFAVTATGPAGQPDPTPATWSWTITTPVAVTVTVSATDPDAAESGTDPGEITVTRNGPTTDPLTVQLTISGTATAGADYTGLPTSIQIPTGQTSSVLAVQPIDDTEPESTETVTVTIDTDSTYTVGTPNSGTVSITDNDDPPVAVTVTVSATDPDAAESGTDPGEITVTRNGPTTDPLTVQLTISGTATAGADYTGLPTSIQIPTGQTSSVLAVQPIDDTEPESTETVTVTIDTDSTYTVGTPNSATVSITDNDDPPVGQEITLTPVADTSVTRPTPTQTLGPPKPSTSTATPIGPSRHCCDSTWPALQGPPKAQSSESSSPTPRATGQPLYSPGPRGQSPQSRGTPSPLRSAALSTMPAPSHRAPTSSSMSPPPSPDPGPTASPSSPNRATVSGSAQRKRQQTDPSWSSPLRSGQTPNRHQSPRSAPPTAPTMFPPPHPYGSCSARP